jgi:hypothetical protein
MKPEQIAAFRVDKTGWADGPWMTEPDRVDFRHAGFACLMLRNARSGNWCGYAGVPPTHPDHGHDYDSVDVKCHGGLTYADKCDGSHICHVAELGEPDDLWWFGFDCHHYRDIAPGLESTIRQLDLDYLDPMASYRDVAYVRREVEALAEQLAARAIAKAEGAR